MRRAVLVTGATGFLGAEIARELSAHDYEIHALVRSGSDRGGMEGIGVVWHVGDLLDSGSIERAARAVAAASGAEPYLVHNAALVSYRTRDAERARAVNVEGTRNVLAAARAAGIARLVHVSSVVAVGRARGDGVMDEDTVFDANVLGVHYVTTKRAAEDLALAAPGLDVRAVNPGVVFGATSAQPNSLRVVERLAAGRAGPLAPPGAVSVVGVRDVAKGVRLALERGRAGRRYLLCESHMRFSELLAAFARELGVRAPARVCPRPAWSALVAMAAAIDRIRPAREATPQALRMLGQSFRASGDRARRELGWNPAPFHEVVRETVAAFYDGR